ncbi:hypothetical protein M1116_01445 [Patescibacteria group bacterium]|nr:hypothetical protein [Patescibacteria group bacterium]
MKNIDYFNLWDSLSRDEEYRALSQGAKEVVKRYVVMLPRLLEEMLDKPVTWENFAAARRAYINYCLENGFAQAWVGLEKLPMGVLPDAYVQALEASMHMAIKELDGNHDDRNKLDECRMAVLTDRQEHRGWGPEAVRKWRSLRIRDLVELNPSALVKMGRLH